MHVRALYFNNSPIRSFSKSNMERLKTFSKLSWEHEFWSLLRYYRSLRIRGKNRQIWLAELKNNSSLPDQPSQFPIKPAMITLLEEYITESTALLDLALTRLRSEKEALGFCKKKKFRVGSTKTSNQSHHQSSKALIATVSGIAKQVCQKAKVEVELDPQRRAVWNLKNGLHVSARNLDGAIPSLQSPKAIWEIKEYWGKTKGGSKMSDAVYECHLVGLELRLFEAKSNLHIEHIVFVDGKEQWDCRKSDLLRFIDLYQQGLVDHLIIGKEVEDEWPQLCEKIAKTAKTASGL